MTKQKDAGQPSTAEILEEVQRRRVARKRQEQQDKQHQLALLANRFILWFSKHWLAVFNTLAFLYVGLPILAPVLMHLGTVGPASVIYTIYRPLCHQLPQRSWFLFGPQMSYRLPELIERTEAVTGPTANSFIGNEALGYKMGICQRDIAIYGTIFLAGLIFGLLRRRRDVRPLPWWAYIALGILPMGLDGGFQLLSYLIPFVFPNTSITPYETTPLMRTITGALFGGATVWLFYPYVQESMDDVSANPSGASAASRQ